MLGILSWIGAGIKSVGQAIALPFIQFQSSSRLQLIARWTIHVMALSGALVGLWFLNFSLRLDTILLAPFPILRSIWLPLLGLQLYAVSWIGWWLCHVMTSRHKYGEFPEIDKTWNRVEAALSKANIDIKKIPLFLFLGKPADSTVNFFNAGRVVRTVPAVPNDASVPFQVFANDEAVYLCCEELSLLGTQAGLFQQSQSDHSPGISNDRGSAVQQFPAEPVSLNASFAEPATSFHRTAPNGPFDTGVGGNTVTAVKKKSASGPSADVVEARSMALIESNLSLLANETSDQPDVMKLAQPGPAVYQPKPKLKLRLLQDESMIESKTSQLMHLCRIISQARAPFCPINGVVTLIPYSASENEVVANHTGMLIERDLQTISIATMVHPPRIAVLGDIQQAVGSSELIARFPAEQRHRRLGVKFPRIPDCDRQKMDDLIHAGMNWLCQQMVPPIVNRLFQTERNTGEEGPVNDANRRLFRFANEIRQRQSAFEQIIRRAFLGNDRKPGLLRGCYFSASGKDTISQQGFTAGILSQVHEVQNDVTWTEDALERDREFHRWVVTGYAGLGTVVTLVLASFLI